MIGGNLGTFNNSQISLGGAPAMPTVGQYSQQATDLFNQLAQPGLDRQTDAARARLAAMGGSEFGSQAGTNLNQQLADMVSRSNMMGAQAGIQQGNEMFNQGMNLHTTGVQDILGERAANLGQLQGLMGLSQGVGVPQYNSFMQSGTPAVADLTGAAQNQYNAQMNKTNAGNADASNRAQAIGTVITAAAVAY